MDYKYYRFGSENSTDIDVLYVFPAIPTIGVCRAFCDQNNENRNIIQLQDGYVADCFKGIPDESNNALWYTYHLHHQNFPMPLKGPVKRHVSVKVIRAVRIVLSYLTRSQDRTIIKKALKSYQLTERLNLLQQLNFNDYQLDHEALKSIAFQLGQTLALCNGMEIYTKSDLIQYKTQLKPFLMRKTGQLNALNQVRDQLIAALEGVDIIHKNGIDSFVLQEGIEAQNLYQKQAEGQGIDVKRERMML